MWQFPITKKLFWTSVKQACNTPYHFSNSSTWNICAVFPLPSLWDTFTKFWKWKEKMQIIPETYPWKTNFKAQRKGCSRDRLGKRPVWLTLNHLTFLCLNYCSSQFTPATLLALLLAPVSSPPGHLEKYWHRAGDGLSKKYFEKHTTTLSANI